MDSSPESEVAIDMSPALKVYKDGRVERLIGIEVVPPSFDPKTGVDSKDFVISAETGVSVRLYLPKMTNPQDQKLPLLVYFHGGGFCIETAFSPTYHNHLNSLVSEANVVVVSVDYRRAPEQLLPICYDDSWAALKWAVSHADQKGPELWLNDHADFERVFFAGDSAGANIAHHMALRAGKEELGTGVKLVGTILVHPFFWGKQPIGSEAAKKNGLVENLWLLVCPSSTDGCDDPWINPIVDPHISSFGCQNVLVCVAEEDSLRDRGRLYYETLGKSGWEGVVQIFEQEGEGHVFHLINPTCEKADAMVKRLAAFVKGKPSPS